MKQLFEINLKLKDGPVAGTVFSLNKIIEGQISIKPLQRIQVDYIGYHLIGVEEKSSKSLIPPAPSIKILSTKYLAQNCLLSEYEPYRYTIRFINNEVETYAGINTHFSVKLQVFIKVNKEAAKATSTILQQLNPINKYPKDGIFQESYFLTFVLKNYEYQLLSKQANLAAASKNQVWNCLFMTLVFIAMIASAFKSIILLAILAFILGIVALIYHRNFARLRDFTIDFEQVDNSIFLFKINNSGNWKYVKKVSVHYEIREQAVYPSQEYSNGIEIEVLHSSSKHTYENLNNPLIIENKFPEDDILGTTIIDETSVYWIALITIHTSSGLELPYEHRFVVRKKAKYRSS